MVNRVQNTSAPGRIEATAASGSNERWIVSVCTENGIPIPARACDTGATELRLQMNRPLPFGSTVRIAVCSGFHSSVAVTDGVVHHCQPADSGWWIGVFLKTCLPDAILADPGTERRAQIRYDVNWRAWLRPCGTSDLVSAVINNYSLSGIRLTVPQAFQTHQLIELLSSPGVDALAVATLRIQSCREEGTREFQVVGRIPDHCGRRIPAVFHAVGGLDISGVLNDTFTSHVDIRADRLRFVVPDAEFASDDQF